MSITLDGNTYEWQHESYQIGHKRLHQSIPTANASSARSDIGPWKRVFNITLLLDNNQVTGGAKTLRANLRTTNAKTTPITFITPDADTYSVFFFDDMVEKLRFSVDTNGFGFEYAVDIVLIEV